MLVVFLFLILGFSFGVLYLLGREKFSPLNLMLFVWLVSIGIAGLHLSPYEYQWSVKFWLILFSFFVVLILTYYLTGKKLKSKITPTKFNWQGSGRVALAVFSVLTLLSLVANLYIYLRFGTLPILSSVPDKMRFIINREVFGLWEYLSLLPRIYIPFLFVYLFTAPNLKRGYKILIWSNIFLGVVILSLYASRLVMVLPLLLSYFAYLYLNKNTINLKKIFSSSIIVLVVVAIIAVSIPAFRNYITYKDYYSDIEYTPFTYLADLSSINMPASLQWAIPLYLIPSFNLQALMRATDFYHAGDYYYGAYGFSVFDSALKIVGYQPSGITIPWKAMFLPWWVTATFLFSYFVDFGYFGIILAGVVWGVILSALYQYATKKPSYLSVMLAAYFSFVVIMSIYTNYMMREEFYLDLVLIFIVSWMLGSRKSIKSLKSLPEADL